MKWIKPALGYAWTVAAFLFFLTALATGMGIVTRSVSVESINKIVGLKFSESFRGGRVVCVITNRGASYETVIHKPVFEGIGNGFVQIDWKPVLIEDPKAGPDASYEMPSLPPRISEDIDYNLDGKKDFSVDFDTGKMKALVVPYASNVIGVDEEWVYFYKSTKGLRVSLKR